MKNVMNRNLLFLVAFLQSTAYSMIWTISALFITGVLKQDNTISGAVIGIAAFFSTIGNFLGGQLFDRWKPKNVLLIATLLALISSVILIFVNSWPVYPILIVFIAFTVSIVNTTLVSYITHLSSQNIRSDFSTFFVMQNVGVVIGTAFVGLVYESFGIQFLMSFGSVIYLLILVIVSLKFVNVVSQEEQNQNEKQKFSPSKLVIALGGLYFVFFMSYMLWETVMATHMRDLGMPIWQFSILWVFNGLLIISLQTPISNFMSRFHFRNSVIIGGLIFAATFIPLIWINQFYQFVILFIFITLGEILISPQIPAWVAAVSSKKQAGRAQGFVSTMQSVGRMVSPFYGGILMDNGLISVLFISISLLMALTVGFIWMLSMKHNQ